MSMFSMVRFFSRAALAPTLLLLLGTSLFSQPTWPAESRPASLGGHPENGGIAFVGSSSIFFWNDLKEDMVGLPATRWGVPGLGIDHVADHAMGFIEEKRPRVIVFYAGENDASAYDKTPIQIAQSFDKFVGAVQARLPETRIIFVSIKPSPGRIDDWPTAQVTNDLIQRYSEGRPNVSYVDASTPLLDSRGQIRPQLYAWDGIHLNDAGYASWTQSIRPQAQLAFEDQIANHGDDPVYLGVGGRLTPELDQQILTLDASQRNALARSPAFQDRLAASPSMGGLWRESLLESSKAVLKAAGLLGLAALVSRLIPGFALPIFTAQSFGLVGAGIALSIVGLTAFKILKGLWDRESARSTMQDMLVDIPSFGSARHSTPSTGTSRDDWMRAYQDFIEDPSPENYRIYLESRPPEPGR